jgi:hypothetical protein
MTPDVRSAPWFVIIPPPVCVVNRSGLGDEVFYLQLGEDYGHFRAQRTQDG